MRAFIQLGGFTFGKTASFYDFFNTSKYSLQTNFIYQDFGGTGIFTYGYTRQVGNGVAVTIAAQDPSPFENNKSDVNRLLPVRSLLLLQLLLALQQTLEPQATCSCLALPTISQMPEP